MKAKHVELLVSIADAGSLGAAADRLNRSQPALTKALKLAESDIGCQIFHRRPHGVVPTVEGQRIIERCRLIHRELTLLDEDLTQLRGDFQGTLNVVVSPSAAMKIIPPVLQIFAQLYPGVQVQVTGGLGPGALQMLRVGQADLLIGPMTDTSTEHSSLQSSVLLRTGVSIITGGSSIYLNDTDPKNLQKAPWGMIGPRDRKPLSEYFFESHGLTVPVPIVCSDSILTILSMIDNSDIVCSCPTLLVPDIESRWNIKALDIQTNIPEISIVLVTDPARLPTPAALAFTDIIKQESARMGSMGESGNCAP